MAYREVCRDDYLLPGGNFTYPFCISFGTLGPVAAAER